MLPRPPGSPVHHQPDCLRHGVARIHGLVALLRSESRFVAIDHAFKHMRCGDAGKIGAARCHGERQTETNKIMCWIANDRLVKVTYLDRDRAIYAGDWPEITNVAVTADPGWWTFRHRGAIGGVEPFVKSGSAATHIGVRRSRHLAITFRREKRDPFSRLGNRL